MRARRLALLASSRERLQASFLAALLLVGCAVPDVDFEGKRCEVECPTQLTCIDGACRRVETSVFVRGFRFDWATPNSIRWAWTLEGPGPELASYELELRREGATPQALRFTSAELLELGGYQLRRSDGFDVLTGVITPGLEPSTVYAATLRVNDVHGHTWSTTTVRGTTDGPRPARLVVFDDALEGNAFTLPQPPRFGPTSGSGLDGGVGLSFRANGDAYENLRVAGLGLSAAPTLTPKLFESAFLEFWVRGRGQPSSSWCEVWIRLGPPPGGTCNDDCIWTFPGQWVYRPDPAGLEWRRVQVPLSAFAQRTAGAAPLTFELLSRPIDEVNVGVGFLDPSDEAHLDGLVVSW